MEGNEILKYRQKFKLKGIKTKEVNYFINQQMHLLKIRH